jgi:ankyrin repeat protein
MATQLPTFPSLDLLKKRARRLLRDAAAGDAKTQTRFRAAIPRLQSRDDAALIAGVQLADAQHVLARELGFPSWPKLKHHVESLQPEPVQAEHLLEAIRDHDRKAAIRLLRQNPKLAAFDAFTASATGQMERLAKAVDSDRGIVHAAQNAAGWTALLYACASPLAATNQRVAARVVRCVELLLARGADPNSSTAIEDNEDGARLAALYYACVNDQPRVVRLLLEHGANPNDGESIYHAAELNHRACLDQLLVHGADVSGPHAYWGNTPLYFLAGYRAESPATARAVEGMRWLVEHGADPNVKSGREEQTPLHQIASLGGSAAAAALLTAHGARVDEPRHDGRTAYALALRAGNHEIAAFLRSQGAASDGLQLTDQLLAAFQMADSAAARALLERDPHLVERLEPDDRQAFFTAAEAGREASVRLMVALGFDPAAEDQVGATALHHAAWHGRPATVKALLELRAPVNARERQFGCSALGWAAHGSQFSRRADDDYCAVVEALIAAGADLESAFNRGGVSPVGLASRRVAALLRKRFAT